MGMFYKGPWDVPTSVSTAQKSMVGLLMASHLFMRFFLLWKKNMIIKVELKNSDEKNEHKNKAYSHYFRVAPGVFVCLGFVPMPMSFHSWKNI